MSDILNKVIVLKLNSAWMGIGCRSVRDAIKDLTSLDKRGRPSAMALDLTYAKKEDGEVDYETLLDTPRTVAWDEWKHLPVRPEDLSILSTSGPIRVPLIIVSMNYSKMPMKRYRDIASRRDIYERDGGVCQATGEYVGWDGGTVDHVYVPKSKGGPKTFRNLAWMRKDINHKKGDKTLEAAGLRLIRKPAVPRDRPISHLLVPRHPSWHRFLPARR